MEMATPMRPWLALACLLLAGPLGGCGDDPRPAASRPGSAGARAAAAPGVGVPAPLDAVEDADIAAEALERLERGPSAATFAMGAPRGPDGAVLGEAGVWTGALHTYNLEWARRDLLAVPDATLALLADDAVVRRLTDVHPRNIGPWKEVLALLRVLPGAPSALVLRYVDPAMGEPHGDYIRMQALRTLAGLRDEVAYARMATLVDAHGANPEISALLAPPLLRAGTTWRALALTTLLRHAEGRAWLRVDASLTGDLPSAQVDLDRADALAWWGVLVDGSGPVLPDTEPAIKRSVAGATGVVLAAESLPGAPGRALGLAPAGRDGWRATSLADDPVMPLVAYLFVGSEPAVAAQCTLARWDRQPYVAAVARDIGREDVDPERAAQARHCMLPEFVGDVRARSADELARWLADPTARFDLVALLRAVNGLPDPRQDLQARALLEQLFERLPDDGNADVVAKRVHDLLAPCEAGLVERLAAMLATGTPVQRQRARTLMLESPDGRHLPALERHLATLSAGEREGIWSRTLRFVATAQGIAPEDTRRWIEQLVERIETLPPEVGASFAPALLDFGEAGAARFAAGLRSASRARFVAGWPAGTQVVPREVAEALLEPLDAATPAQDVLHALTLAYRSFPPSAAPALAALASRLPRDVARDVEPVLHRVRRRAGR